VIPRFSLVGAMVLAACAHGSHAGNATAPAGDTGAPPPAGPTVTVVRSILYQPGTTRYVARSRTSVTQEMMGQTQHQEFGLTSYLTVTLAAGREAGGYQFTLMVDSVVSDSGAPSMPGVDLAQMRRVRATGTVGPSGVMRDFAPDSTAPAALRGVLAGLREFLPELPNSGLTPSARWIDTTERKQPTGSGDIAIKSVRTHEVGDWLDHEGTRALELRVSSTYTMNGTLSQGGQDLNLDGSGTRRVRSLIATNGRYLGGESADSSAMTVLIPAAGMAVPVTQVQSTTVRALP
jgi:hypothetical protein